jgi:NitT/TauT family transport system permease protein
MQDAPADAALSGGPARMTAGALARIGIGRPRWRSMMLLLAQLCLIAGFLIFWQIAVSDRNVAFFSRPAIVASKLVELALDPDFHHDIVVTLVEIAIGYGIGAGIGLALGFILGRSRLLTDLLEPFIIGLYSIPKIALAPLFIVWLGLGMPSKVAVVVLATFFLVFFNTYSGLLNVNEELVRLARLMGASWHQCIFRVILPSAAHQIFIGLKTAVPYAVIGAVIGEYIGSNAGLGHFILYASQTYDAPALFSGILALVVIVFFCNFVLNGLERRVIRWRHIEGGAVQL